MTAAAQLSISWENSFSIMSFTDAVTRMNFIALQLYFVWGITTFK
jgi:hypothetical protein